MKGFLGLRTIIHHEPPVNQESPGIPGLQLIKPIRGMIFGLTDFEHIEIISFMNEINKWHVVKNPDYIFNMDKPRVRGLTAKDLTAKSDNRIIQDFVQKLVISIDAEIASLNKAGLSLCRYELPTNIPVNNLSKTDVQTVVYSELLLIYSNPEDAGGKGFDRVYIDLQGQKTFIQIHWMNGITDADRATRKAIISKHQLR